MDLGILEGVGVHPHHLRQQVREGGAHRRQHRLLQGGQRDIPPLGCDHAKGLAQGLQPRYHAR
jgi:hypothetical protein